MGYTIRPAAEADLLEIQRIYNRAILSGVATWDEEPWSMGRRIAWWLDEHRDDPWSPVLVADDGEGGLAGFAYLSRMSQKSGWRFTREDTIYIDDAHQGKGSGARCSRRCWMRRGGSDRGSSSRPSKARTWPALTCTGRSDSWT